MEIGAVLSLGAVTLFLIGLVVFFLKRIQKTAQKDAPESIFVKPRLTLAGATLMACLLGFFLICLVARETRPTSSLGNFVGTIDGVIIVVVAAIVVLKIISEILKSLGYPFVKED